MQIPNPIMYKFFDNNIQDVLQCYLDHFVKIHRNLIGTGEKIGFLVPPVDFSKLHQGDNLFYNEEVLADTFRQRKSKKPYRVQCFIGGIKSSKSIAIEIFPSLIPHITLEPQNSASISEYKVGPEGYINHLINNNIVDVVYYVGKKLKGGIQGVYGLGKVFIHHRIEKLMQSITHEPYSGGLSRILSIFRDVLDQRKLSTIQEVDDDPKTISAFLKKWDRWLIDNISNDKLQTQLSIMELSLKDWLEK